MNKQEHIRGWYNMVGGAAGFLLIESSDPQQVDEFLLPYMDIMSGDVRAVNALDDIAAIDRLCQSTQTATGSGAQELVP